jgi:hypothetical protein
MGNKENLFSAGKAFSGSKQNPTASLDKARGKRGGFEERPKYPSEEDLKLFEEFKRTHAKEDFSLLYNAALIAEAANFNFKEPKNNEKVEGLCNALIGSHSGAAVYNEDYPNYGDTFQEDKEPGKIINRSGIGEIRVATLELAKKYAEFIQRKRTEKNKN